MAKIFQIFSDLVLSILNINGSKVFFQQVILIVEVVTQIGNNQFVLWCFCYLIKHRVKFLHATVILLAILRQGQQRRPISLVVGKYLQHCRVIVDRKRIANPLEYILLLLFLLLYFLHFDAFVIFVV